MRGSTVAELLVTERGGLGDRVWALRDLTSGRIMSAKRFPRLLDFRAGYEVEPTPSTCGRVRVEAPGGQAMYADQQEPSELISRILGRRLLPESHAGADEKTGIDRRTVHCRPEPHLAGLTSPPGQRPGPLLGVYGQDAIEVRGIGTHLRNGIIEAVRRLSRGTANAPTTCQ